MPLPDLTWTAQGEPRSLAHDDGYFASGQGPGETLHVFIEGSRLSERYARHPRQHFVVGELGFGTGLSFLLCCQHFLRHAPAALRLHYWSVDAYPLEAQSLQQAAVLWPDLADLVAELLERYPPRVPGVHRRHFAGGRVIVDFVWAEARDALVDLASLDRPLVDAWFLDGFAPSRNPDMWSDDVFHSLARCSHRGASVATYSAASGVRRGLAAAGFVLAKRPGFGRKRECVAGTLGERPQATCGAMTPWDLPEEPGADARADVIVLGAGLAGAHAAAALARRGVGVTVLEAGRPADRASGNPQGVLFTRLSHERSTLLDFSLLAFLYAQSLYRELFDEGRLRRGLDGDLGGCLQALVGKGADPLLEETLAALPEIGHLTRAEKAAVRLGTNTELDGIWQPGSGWLSPPAVCRALLAQPGVQLHTDCGPVRLHRGPGTTWQALNAAGDVLAEAGRAVIALGSAARDLHWTRGLPLKVVRGQTTQIPAPPEHALRSAFCHRGYIAPAMGGEHCIGATFDLNDESREWRASDNEANLCRLAAALPAWRDYLASLDPCALAGRAELRCVSPDYLPLAGPVADQDAFLQRYASLGQDARRIIDARAPCQPGLYLITAMGSRGLSYAALAAERLASELCGEPPPLSRELLRALSPARFILRGIVRGQHTTTRKPDA